MTTSQQKIERWPVFICYRQADGKSAATYVHELLHGQKVEAIDPITGKLIIGELDVYFDQASPASPNWEKTHEPYLKLARAFIVICSPGAKIYEGKEDWVHKELQWWLENGVSAPILVDPLGADRIYVPDSIASRWPKAQRITLNGEHWLGLSKSELKKEKQSVYKRLVGGVIDVGEHYLLREMKTKAEQANALEEAFSNQQLINKRFRIALTGAVLALFMVIGAGYYSFQQSQILAKTVISLNNQKIETRNALSIAQTKSSEAEDAAKRAILNEIIANKKAEELAEALKLSDSKSAELLVSLAADDITTGNKERATLQLLEAYRLGQGSKKSVKMRTLMMQALEMPITNFFLPKNAEMRMGKKALHVSGADWFGKELKLTPGVIWHGNELSAERKPFDSVMKITSIIQDEGLYSTCLKNNKFTKKLMNRSVDYGFNSSITCENHKGFDLFRFSIFGTGGESQEVIIIDDDGIAYPISTALEKSFTNKFHLGGDVITWAGLRRLNYDQDLVNYEAERNLVLIYRDEIVIWLLHFDYDTKKFEESHITKSFKLPFQPDNAVLVPGGIVVSNSKQHRFSFVSTDSISDTVGFSKDNKKSTEIIDNDNEISRCPISNIDLLKAFSINCSINIYQNTLVLKKLGEKDLHIPVFTKYDGEVKSMVVVRKWLFVPMGERVLQLDLEKIWLNNGRIHTDTDYNALGFNVIPENALDVAVYDSTSFLIASNDDTLWKIVVNEDGSINKIPIFGDRKSILGISNTSVKGQYVIETISGGSQIGYKLIDLNEKLIIKDFGESYKGNSLYTHVDENGALFVNNVIDEATFIFALPSAMDLEAKLMRSLPERCHVVDAETWFSSKCFE